MYEAHLSDPAVGEVTEQGETEDEAVEKAFRKLMGPVMAEEDLGEYKDKPMFDGEIRGNEVWFHNRQWGLIGTVKEIKEPGPQDGDSLKAEPDQVHSDRLVLKQIYDLVGKLRLEDSARMLTTNLWHGHNIIEDAEEEAIVELYNTPLVPNPTGPLKIELTVEGQGTAGTDRGGEDLNLLFRACTDAQEPETFAEFIKLAKIEVVFMEGEGCLMIPDPREVEDDRDLATEMVEFKTFHYDFSWKGTRAEALALVEKNLRNPKFWTAQGPLGAPAVAVFSQDVFIDGNAE
jgi:hypothetical protein